ncbi:hypothetical protein RvY_18934 [Ramazzottius varieornatus]|uniref:Uncharacterized protein n=1 Tax=Ramazzottius varieornatus TaxID=947166 RepID=A0A1D1W7N3_RAMVA|nr:hypothetical protein RvY_18934 [Ramazzottius varieornatus]
MAQRQDKRNETMAIVDRRWVGVVNEGGPARNVMISSSSVLNVLRQVNPLAAQHAPTQQLVCTHVDILHMTSFTPDLGGRFYAYRNSIAKKPYYKYFSSYSLFAKIN